MLKPKPLLFVLAIVLGLGTWYYLFGVFLPYIKSHEPAGMSWSNRTDLYPRWFAARELLLHHRDPYSPEITREIQLGYYGKTVKTGGFPGDEQRFAYPVYTVFFLAPTILSPFSLVNACFGVLLFGLTTGSVLLWIDALNLKLTQFTKLTCILFVLASWPAAQGIHARQLSLLVAFLLAASAWAISRGRFVIAGLIVACATIKPQLVLLTLAWFLVWAFQDWQKRRSFVWSFAAGSGALLIGAELILPGWFREWRASLPAYLAYTGSIPSLERLFGVLTGRVLELILLTMVSWHCWKSRMYSADSPSFGLTLTLVLSTTLVLLPTWSLASYNEVLLLPAILWIIAAMKQPTLARGVTVLCTLAIVAVAWESISASVIAVAGKFPTFVVSESVLRVPVYFYFLLPALVTISLMTIAPKTISEEISL